ncbi:MAG: aldehyde dehydrogenase [Bacteroidota bacterium]
MDSQISSTYTKQHDFFKTGRTKEVAYRKQALKRLKKVIEKREDDICNALYLDFKKPKFESLVSETQFVLAELKYILAHMDFWARPKKVAGSLGSFPSKDWIQYEPFGNVLVISPWNYPFMLAISPLIGALAAGNTIVLKPSELSPATSKILTEIISEAFDSSHVCVIEGGVDASQELLSNKWDYIFFTGSTRVGKIVYQSAAKHLTPVTLELGGKNPCIVDDSASISVAAKRITWGKLLNAGQTCLAPDYILVQNQVKNRLVEAIKKTVYQFYGDDIEASSHLARIATKNQYNRLKTMLKDEKVMWGGQYNDGDQYIAPTLIDAPAFDSAVMEDEIFGPILPIYGYDKKEEIDSYLSRFGKPLALYVFSKRGKFQNEMMQNHSFGGGVINDCVIHIANKKMPFGGIGSSGFGGYHGEYSFQLFSHKKSIVKKPFLFDIPVRYPPYTLSETIIKRLKSIL